MSCGLELMYFLVLIQAVRKVYSQFKEENPMQEIVFECAEIELDLPFSSPITVDGWKIAPLKLPMVIIIFGWKMT